MSEFAFLLFGHDTVICAYWLATTGCAIDFDSLAAQREGLRLAKGRNRRGKAVELGGRELMLAPNGSKSGYPFILECPDFTIQCGPYNSPSFYVHFHSRALWSRGPVALHQEFIAWAEKLNLRVIKPETLSRVDPTFDYLLPICDFDEDSVVTQLELDRRYRRNRATETMMFGSGDALLRVYDKVKEIRGESGKTWFFKLWDQDRDVWRIEWQLRRAVLQRFGIRTFADLLDQQGDLLAWLAGVQTSIRVKSADGNRSRWPVHPLWADLRERIAQLGRVGIAEEIGPESVLEVQRLRCLVQLYGYMKRLGAIEGALQGGRELSLDETLIALQRGLERLHDRATWRDAVRGRLADLRLRPS